MRVAGQRPRDDRQRRSCVGTEREPRLDRTLSGSNYTPCELLRLNRLRRRGTVHRVEQIARFVDRCGRRQHAFDKCPSGLAVLDAEDRRLHLVAIVAHEQRRKYLGITADVLDSHRLTDHERADRGRGWRLDALLSKPPYALAGLVCQRLCGERSKRCEDARGCCIPASLDRTHHSRAHFCRYFRLLQGDEERRGELLQLGGMAERRFVVEHLQKLRNDLPLQNLGLDFGDVGGHYRSVGVVSVRTRACPTLFSAKVQASSETATGSLSAPGVAPAGSVRSRRR